MTRPRIFQLSTWTASTVNKCNNPDGPSEGVGPSEGRGRSLCPMDSLSSQTLEKSQIPVQSSTTGSPSIACGSWWSTPAVHHSEAEAGGSGYLCGKMDRGASWLTSTHLSRRQSTGCVVPLRRSEKCGVGCNGGPGSKDWGT